MDTNIELKNRNPKETANPISKLLFTWMISLYRKGAKKTLEVSDLYTILQSDISQTLADKLEANWTQELTKKRPKLLTAIFKTFIWSYVPYGVWLFIQMVFLRSIQPVFMSYLIALFDDGAIQSNQLETYISAGVLVGISLIVVTIMHHCNFGQLSVGMRVRIAVSSLIYRKTLKLNKKSLNQTAVGYVINLLSNDVNRFDLVMFTLHYLWILPFQVAVVTYLLWLQAGLSSLTGVVAIALLALPVQGYLGKLTSNFRSKVARKTDYRVTLMSEIIAGIQVIKMYAWEKPFRKLVKVARGQEVDSLTHISYLRGIFLSFMIFVERAALFLALLTQFLMGEKIFAENVFSMAQFFNLLQLTMSIYYPMAVNYGAETLVAIQRIEEFLMMEENPVKIEHIIKTTDVELFNVSAAWTPGNLILKNINLKIPKGTLCMIVGPVGAGKSSFLQLLLRELTPECGCVKIDGKISYASQEPWLFSSTIRSNILFGEEYHKKIYNKVVKVCALQEDFDQFPMRDRSLVGEKGSSLSGGQKARVNLARAVYRNADCYLLDDPLSAVDSRVGKHLFQECILDYLSGKTRILVTHQLQYLRQADYIVCIDEGKIAAQGTYENIVASGFALSENCVQEEETKKYEKQTSAVSDVDSVDGDSQTEEEEKLGQQGANPLLDYIRACGSFWKISLAVFTLLFSQILVSACDYWVTFWTQQEALKYQNVTIPAVEPILATNTCVYIYTGLVISLVSLVMFRSLYFFKLAMNSSKNLHDQMFKTLLEVPMRFFNTNPTGRILNRFSKDMGAVDEILPKVLLESVQITLVMFGILLLVVISNYLMIVAILILGYTFMRLRYWFIRTAKDIKHLEGITKSPVFSHLNSSLHGITTIRAFGAEGMLKHEFDNHQDVHTSAWFLTIGCMTSFGLWLDLICVVFIFCTTFSFIILNQFGQVSGSMVGLAISQSLILTGMLQYGIRQTAEVINQLTSVERVLQYSQLEKEGPFDTIPGNEPPKNWPDNGFLQFKHLYLYYTPGDPAVLRNLNMKVKPGQKIGIVGRTGAGKSSLISALFRLSDIRGNIFIDNIDTQTLGLTELRKNISIIPQEPVLFSASMRYNLDPFHEYPDEQLWNALEEVELKDHVHSLDMMIAGGGGNFSIGQRQLICLARAILRNNKILVLDEATANIDPNTDALIQATIRKKFENCTVLTVAHRLNTIMDSDRVLVMNNGKIAEFDYPYILLQKTDSLFKKMVEQTGIAMSNYLEDMALDSFLNRRQKCN